MSDRLIQHLIHLASRLLTAPACPFDGTELDLHFHGGASCPTCGHEFELGHEDQLLPSDRSIEEEAARWPDTIPAHFANDWMPSLNTQEARPDQPYPFIYHPPSGWLAWGRQNGLHDEIVNSLYQQGIRVPAEAVFGRYYPTNENHNVIVYDPQFRQQPQRQVEKHLETIRRNAPERPQEATGGPSMDFWGKASSFPEDLEEEADWKPSIPSLEEVAQPSPERYFKWLYHPDYGHKIWEVDGPDGHPWHSRMETAWLGGYPDKPDMVRGYGVLNHNGGVVHNYGSGYKTDLLPLMARRFQDEYPQFQWVPYAATEPEYPDD